MKYSIKVNEVRAKEGSNIKGFATVVFGDSFKITNIAILENKDKGELFVSMPRYRSNERDESNGVIYKDVCNPITAEFREELYTNILDAYARIKESEKEETQKQEHTKEMPEFSVTVTPYEREGSNIKGLARIYFENSFIVNNINIVQGRGTIKTTDKDIAKTALLAKGFREAGQTVANAFRTFADKPEVDYSQKEQKHPITKAVLAPMKAVKKMLVTMELHLDASIDKLDNLAMNVQLDKEKHMENEKKQEAAHKEVSKVREDKAR